MSTRFDVVIVGGAMTGASLALAIAQQQPNWHIALIEAQALNFGTHRGFDGRAIALNAGSMQWFAQLGLAKALAQRGASIAHIHVSDRAHLGQVHLQASDYQLQALGYVVELADAGRILHEALVQCANVTLFCPQQVTNITAQQTHIQVQLDNGQELETALLVGADGYHSVVAKQFRFDESLHDFNKHAIIANLRSTQLPEGRAFERFTESGPLALLPLSDGRWSLVWSLEPNAASELMRASKADFLHALQGAFGWRVGRFCEVGQRATYPLRLQYRAHPISHRAVLVGNAAQSLHPVAGQGFNLALRDVACLATLICTQPREQLGSFAQLSQYRQARLDDVQRTLSMTSTLASFFASSDKTYVVARNMGLVTMNLSRTLKDAFARQCLGY